MIESAEASIAEGRLARKENDLVAARAHYAAAAALYRQRNELLAYAHTIRHVADILLKESKFGEASAVYEEALDIYRSNLDTKLLDLANTVRPYALLQERCGNLDGARVHWREARNLYASLRIEAGVAECEAHLRELGQGLEVD